MAVAALPWVAAIVLFCSTVVAGADRSLAQTATNLKCKKCVNTRDLDRRAVSRSRFRNGAIDFRKLEPSVEAAIRQDRAYYLALDGNGAEATLVTQGPLTLSARCFVNDGGNDRIELVFTSSQDGWFALGSGTTERAAGEEVVAGSASVPAGITDFPLIQVFGAAAADGSAINPRIAWRGGFNVFGHDCLVIGSAAAFAGNP